MKVIIAGSRGLRDQRIVTAAMQKAEFEKGIKPTAIICGEARGADLLGKRWAQANGIDVISMPAEWDKHGRSAGPIRNGEMAELADALVAVWDGESVGTRDMIRKANKRNIPVYIHYYDDADQPPLRLPPTRPS